METKMIGNGNKQGTIVDVVTSQANGIWSLSDQIKSRRRNIWPPLYLSPANKFPNTLDIFAWTSTSANAATLTRDTTVTDSPYGGIPMKMEVTGDDPHTGKYNTLASNITAAVNGETWEVRVLAKASVATTGQIFIFGADSTGNWASGGAGGTSLPITAFTFNIGTNWAEFSHRITMDKPEVAFIQSRLDGPDAGGTGVNIWWDGWQVYKIS
jgi:hypothetical protein